MMPTRTELADVLPRRSVLAVAAAVSAPTTNTTAPPSRAARLNHPRVMPSPPHPWVSPGSNLRPDSGLLSHASSQLSSPSPAAARAASAPDGVALHAPRVGARLEEPVLPCDRRDAAERPVGPDRHVVAARPQLRDDRRLESRFERERARVRVAGEEGAEDVVRVELR